MIVLKHGERAEITSLAGSEARGATSPKESSIELDKGGKSEENHLLGSSSALFSYVKSNPSTLYDEAISVSLRMVWSFENLKERSLLHSMFLKTLTSLFLSTIAFVAFRLNGLVTLVNLDQKRASLCDTSYCFYGKPHVVSEARAGAGYKRAAYDLELQAFPRSGQNIISQLKFP